MVTRIEGKVEALTDQVAQTREMVEAWQAVKTGGKAITWFAKVLAGIVAVIAIIKVSAAALVE
jgi:hypothetical protein